MLIMLVPPLILLLLYSSIAICFNCFNVANHYWSLQFLSSLDEMNLAEKSSFNNEVSPDLSSIKFFQKPVEWIESDIEKVNLYIIFLTTLIFDTFLFT